MGTDDVQFVVVADEQRLGCVDLEAFQEDFKGLGIRLVEPDVPGDDDRTEEVAEAERADLFPLDVGRAVGQ